MRQIIITTSLIGSLAIFALTIDLFEHVVMFALFGFIPGRSEPLSANQMLAIYSFATLCATSYQLRAHLAVNAKRLLAIRASKQSTTA